jgi:hypothetical protein
MLIALLGVVSAAGSARSKELCWEMKDGYNAVSRMVRSPKTERRPEVFYFGEVGEMEACRVACEREDECFAFTWMGPASGGWGGGKWAHQCCTSQRSNETIGSIAPVPVC